MKKFIALFMVLLMVEVIFIGCKTTIVKSETTSAITKSVATSTTSPQPQQLKP